MNILLSAYACEPDRGSEPGVGWNWALRLQSAGHDVTVLTRANNRAAIEGWAARNREVRMPEFVYYDLPKAVLRLKGSGVLPVQLYYYLWQLGVLRPGGAVAAQRRYDLVWHLTFASIQQPSLLWRLGVPFVFGPAGGGERAPWRMRVDYPFRGHLSDALRDIRGVIARLDPLMRCTLANASVIFVTTPESRRFVPLHKRNVASTRMAIGVSRACLLAAPARSSDWRGFLYVGRLLYWKGCTLLIRAFAEYRALGGLARLTVVGKGPEEARCRRLAERLGIGEALEWVPWIDQSRLWALYREHSVFVFPTLHDSSGNVVVEAMAQGLPIICFDLGGPAEIVTPSCGVIVSTAKRDGRSVAQEMGRQMKALEGDPERTARLADGALARAREFTWDQRVEQALRHVETALAERDDAAGGLAADLLDQ